MNKNFILTFHSVTNKDWFEKTIKFFVSNFRLVNSEELYTLMSSKKRFKNIAHLTVDDGNKSFYEVIYPVLKKYNAPATLFVSPQIIEEQKNFWFQQDKGLDSVIMNKILSEELNNNYFNYNRIPYHIVFKCLTIEQIKKILERYYSTTQKTPIQPQNMTLEQLVQVDRSGIVTIGAHTMSHPILANESAEVADKEISTSIKRLEEILGHPIHFFAYPNGIPYLDFGQREIDILKRNNIKLAFSGEFRSVNQECNLYSMPRIGFSTGGTSTIRMKLFLGKYWLLFKSLKNVPEENLRIRVKNILIASK